MTYRKIGGLHWLAIGRLRVAFCIIKRRPLAPTYPDTHYRPLPRANWKDTRAERHGANAVSVALHHEAIPVLARPSMPKAH